MAAEQEEELDDLRRQLKDLQEEAQEGKGLRAALRKKDGEVRGNQCGVGEGERSVSHHCSSFNCPPCPALPAVSWQVEALRDALQELERELEEAKKDMTELVDDRQSVSGQGAGQEDPSLAGWVLRGTRSHSAPSACCSLCAVVHVHRCRTSTART